MLPETTAVLDDLPIAKKGLDRATGLGAEVGASTSPRFAAESRPMKCHPGFGEVAVRPLPPAGRCLAAYLSEEAQAASARACRSWHWANLTRRS